MWSQREPVWAKQKQKVIFQISFSLLQFFDSILLPHFWNESGRARLSKHSNIQLIYIF